MHLSLEDNLLVTGFAIFVALCLEQCSLTIYHLKLLSFLFVMIFATSGTLLWAGRFRSSRVVLQLWAWAAHSKPMNNWVAIAIVMCCLTLMAVLGAASFAIAMIAFMNGRFPSFSQPAMAVQAFCFLPDKFPSELHKHVDTYNKAQHLAGLVMGASVSCFGFHCLMYCRRDRADPVNRGRSSLCHACFRMAVFSGHALVCGLATVQYLREWTVAQKYIDPATSEKAWGFGQIVPVMLLVVPILSFFGASIGALLNNNHSSFLACLHCGLVVCSFLVPSLPMKATSPVLSGVMPNFEVGMALPWLAN